MNGVQYYLFIEQYIQERTIHKKTLNNSNNYVYK